MIAAIIVAAGQGLRMGGDIRKQYLNLRGTPIIAHTIQQFLSCASINLIVVVLPPDEVEQFDIRQWVDPFPKERLRFVAGGADRCESVFNGLGAIEADDGIVLIHDGVRPLVPTWLIESCIEGAGRWEACVPALAAVDTVKMVGDDDTVKETLPRQDIYLTQTPQAFKLSLIRNVHRLARKKSYPVTDDASLVEQAGVAVKVIQGAELNIKITTPLDLMLAETYLQIMERSAADALNSEQTTKNNKHDTKGR